VSYYLHGFHVPPTLRGLEAETAPCDVTLSAVHDPGYAPVVVSGFIILAGVTLTFHFPHRRLWARVGAHGETWLVGSTAWDKERFSHQFEGLVSELRRAASAADGERKDDEIPN
jgi:hypothetical protein